MVLIQIAAAATVAAPPAVVYGVIADYRQHHPHILPPTFSHLTVLEGGVGAGTVATFDFRLLGRTFPSRITVSEPEPGRILEEADGRITTRFSVEPAGDGSQVRIVTTWQSPGLQGLIERLIVPRILHSVYLDELRRLDAYARGQVSPPK